MHKCIHLETELSSRSLYFYCIYIQISKLIPPGVVELVRLYTCLIVPHPCEVESVSSSAFLRAVEAAGIKGTLVQRQHQQPQLNRQGPEHERSLVVER